MSADERRYSDDEVREIFERATEVESGASRTLPAPEGLSLPQLQEIGREIGIAPDVVAQAAASLDQPGITVTPASRFLGVPVGVSRTLYLDRRLTDREWERLVMELREVFDAPGRVHEQGPFRQWSNGNLRAMLEPTDEGERLRLRTVKGDGRSTLAAGAGLLAGGVGALLLSVLTGNAGAYELAIVCGLTGGGTYLVNLIRLPRWAAIRARQMEGIIERLKAALSPPGTLPGPSDDAGA